MVERLNQGYVNLIKDLNRRIKGGRKRKPIGEDIIMRKKDITDLGRSVQAQIDASSPRPMKQKQIIITSNVRRLTD